MGARIEHILALVESRDRSWRSDIEAADHLRARLVARAGVDAGVSQIQFDLTHSDVRTAIHPFDRYLPGTYALNGDVCHVECEQLGEGRYRLNSCGELKSYDGRVRAHARFILEARITKDAVEVLKSHETDPE